MSKLCFGCMQQKQNSPVCEHCGFDERTENLSHQLPIGTLLQNQYLVGRVLGQGGFGITYMGWDQHLSIPVAIKEYFPGGVVQRNTRWSTNVMCSTGETPEIFAKHRERFLKEARTLAQLSDVPEIVQIKSFFSGNDTAYIVMEYVQGITLKDHLKKQGRPMTEGEVLTVMEPVLKALQKVHDHGLIHRDISPDNIMLPVSGGVKLIDFGTVRYMDDSGKSKSTEAVLKAGFAPMEQYNTRGNLGTWTDVYALCATFHYLLTGKVPADVHERMEQGESLTLLRSRGGLSQKLISALEKGMKLRAQDRVQTVGELYRLLYAEADSDAETPKTEKQQKPAGHRRKKRLPAVLAAGTAAIAAAAMLLIPKAQKADSGITIPTVPETMAVETTLPQSVLSAEEQLYQRAESLEAAGEYGKAAIAFGNLGNYEDARERSFALWQKVPNRRTISFYLWERESEEYLMFHALLDDGTVAADCRKSESLSEQDYDNYYTSSYRDIVSIHEAIGLRYDGTLALPGTDFPYYQELSGWTDLVAISVPHDPYEAFFVGLKSDGTVISVGSNKYGECDVSGWTDIVSIHAGQDCTFGVRTDGTVVATGRNRQGMCEVRDWTDIKEVTSYDLMTFGLKTDGTMVAVGSNYTRAITDAERQKEIAFIDGRWFFKTDGSCTVLVNGGWTDVRAFAYCLTSDGQEFVGLREDGTFRFSRGWDGSYARARTWTNVQYPAPPEGTSARQEQENAYAEAERLLADGEIAKAAIAFGKLGDYKDARQRSFELWAVVTHRDTVSAAHNFTVAVLEDGSGKLLQGNLPDGGEGAAVWAHISPWRNLVSISASDSHIVGLQADGTVLAKGNDNWYDLSVLKNVVAIATGRNHTVGLKPDGTVVASGANEYGQCNTSGWNDIIAIDAAASFTVALKADGTVVAVGDNTYQQCDVCDWTDIVAVRAGLDRTLGIRSDGTLVTTKGASNITVPQNLSVDVLDLGANWTHIFVVQTDGSLKGAFIGGTSHRHETDYVAISVCDTHFAGLREDGTLFISQGWGDVHQFKFKLPTQEKNW